MKRLFLAGVVVLIRSQAFAEAPDSTSTTSTPPAQSRDAVEPEASLATPTGHEVNLSVGGYNYVEPGDLRVSMHGAKVAGEYTGTLVLSERRRWFVQANVRGTFGNVTYDGFCLPWIISPNIDSPNGYELDLGDASPCSESGDNDWYVEARALVGKDFIGQKWGWSPYIGVGLRHLSNGTNGVAGYRTDDYLYPPVGITTRTRVASQGVLSFNLEYDPLIHGWQDTRNSELGGGDIPATPTAPAFTLDGLTDVSFSQHTGWGLRASAKYEMTKGWSVEPYYVHWSIGSSVPNYITATFTVMGVTAQEQLQAYEPYNTTNELGVKLGFHFR